jgi:hypothetical protein
MCRVANVGFRRSSCQQVAVRVRYPPLHMHEQCIRRPLRRMTANEKQGDHERAASYRRQDVDVYTTGCPEAVWDA